MKAWAKWFYLSDAWRKTRKAFLEYRGGLCERCKSVGEIAHHRIYITPQNIHDTHITLDWNNLELLCQDCHNKEHSKKEITRYSFDANGNISPPYLLKFGFQKGTGRGR